MSEQSRISDERLAELIEYWQDWDASQISEHRQIAEALRELAALRRAHREIICRRCGHREQLGEVPNADF